MTLGMVLDKCIGMKNRFTKVNGLKVCKKDMGKFGRMV